MDIARWAKANILGVGWQDLKYFTRGQNPGK